MCSHPSGATWARKFVGNRRALSAQLPNRPVDRLAGYETTGTPGRGRRSTAASRRRLQPRRLGEIDPKPVAAALVAPGHFGGGVAELLLHPAFVDLGGGGEAGAQRMAGEFLPPVRL